MGARGPAPKRTRERLGHMTKAEKSATSTVVKVDRVVIPPCPSAAHPIARRWYNALKKSGQSDYFEPSDWAAALYVVEGITRNLEGTRFSAQLFATVWSAMESLLTTEQARRRARVEVERGVSEPEDKPTALDAYRKMVSQ